MWSIKFITHLIRFVPLLEQELPTLPEHLSSHPVFSGVCFTRSLVLCVCFVDRCLSFCLFSFDHCVVCPSIDRIGGVMISVLASNAVDRGFESRAGQTKAYEIGMYCFSAKHAALRRKRKDW